MNVLDLAGAIHALLDAHHLPHAFGGALALNLYAEPRMTVDVDVSVFAPWADRDSIVVHFAEIGLHPEDPEDSRAPVAGIRLVADDGPGQVDLFLALDPTYAQVLARVVVAPLGRGGEPLPFLAAADVAAFKLSFNRPKDWVDLQSMIRSGTSIDVDTVEDTLLAMRGPTMQPRIARLRAMIRADGDLP